jgi:hypothetical protein
MEEEQQEEQVDEGQKLRQMQEKEQAYWLNQVHD